MRDVAFVRGLASDEVISRRYDDLSPETRPSTDESGSRS
jgi:hypothetical protein